MRGLKTLVSMQLKDKMDLSFAKSVKQVIFKVVLAIVKFIVVTAIIYGLFYVLNFLRLVSVLPGIPQDFLTVIFTLMFILSIFTCTFGLMKSLYFSKDNAFLLTMPTNRLSIFSSKIIVYYIYELIRNLTYILPLFIAYGMINSLPIYFYFWLVAMIPLLSGFSVAIGTLLSIVAMLITKLFKSHKWLEYTAVVIIVGGLVISIISIINLIPENLDIIGSWGTTFWQIQNFMGKFVKIFSPFAWIVTAVVGKRIGVGYVMFNGQQFLTFGAIIITTAIIMAIAFVLVRPIFFNMVSSPFEFKKKDVNKNFTSKKRNSVWSSVKKDINIYYRTPEKFYSLLFVLFGLPISILLLNKIYLAMDTRLTGTFMTVAFNILVILLFALSSNVAISHVFSEDGASSYLMKTFPKPYLQTTISKLIINFVTASISLLASVVIFTKAAGFDFFTKVLIYLSLLAVYIGHLLWTAESDIVNSQTHQYQTSGSHINNPNETKAVLTSILLSVMFAFITYFFIRENQVQVWFRLLFIASLFLAGRTWLFVNKVNVYFKERD